MWSKRILIAAVLSFGGLLMGASSARAQGYGRVYGYYYPDSREFVTFQERPHFQFNVTPERMEAFTHQQLSDGHAPTRSNSATAVAQTVSIEVTVPNALARLWFDGAS